jgi:hypothetical protein
VWDRYVLGLIVENIGPTFEGTWTRLHGDGKSSTRAALLSWTMKTKSGLKVKLTYKGQRLFEEEIVEVRDSAEMIEAQSRLRRHVSKEVRLEDDEFNRLKTTLTKARTTQISDQKAQVIEAIKHGMQVNLFIPFLIFD